MKSIPHAMFMPFTAKFAIPMWAQVMLFKPFEEADCCLLACTIWSDCTKTKGEPIELEERFIFHAN